MQAKDAIITTNRVIVCVPVAFGRQTEVIVHHEAASHRKRARPATDYVCVHPSNVKKRSTIRVTQSLSDYHQTDSKPTHSGIQITLEKRVNSETIFITEKRN